MEEYLLLGDNTGGEARSAAADQLPAWWSLYFNWIPLYIHIDWLND